MKKMLVIIFILLIIFIGIYINKKNIGNEIVTATEVNNIEEYISKIYMWQEITEEALPKFNNIGLDGKKHMIFNWFEWYVYLTYKLCKFCSEPFFKSI